MELFTALGKSNNGRIIKITRQWEDEGKLFLDKNFHHDIIIIFRIFYQKYYSVISVSLEQNLVSRYRWGDEDYLLTLWSFLPHWEQTNSKSFNNVLHIETIALPGALGRPADRRNCPVLGFKGIAISRRLQALPGTACHFCHNIEYFPWIYDSRKPLN